MPTNDQPAGIAVGEAVAVGMAGEGLERAEVAVGSTMVVAVAAGLMAVLSGVELVDGAAVVAGDDVPARAGTPVGVGISVVAEALVGAVIPLVGVEGGSGDLSGRRMNVLVGERLVGLESTSGVEAPPTGIVVGVAVGGGGNLRLGVSVMKPMTRPTSPPTTTSQPTSSTIGRRCWGDAGGFPPLALDGLGRLCIFASKRVQQAGSQLPNRRNLTPRRAF